MRMTLRNLAAAGCSLLIGVAAAAAEPVDIKFKWSKGEPVVYRMTQKMAGTVTMPGQPPMRTSQEVVTTTTMNVEEIAEDGVATVRVTTDAVRAELDLPMMGKVVYDSTAPDAGGEFNPMTRGFVIMVGESFTLVVTPMGEVRKVEGVDRIFDKLAAENAAPQMIAAMKQSMGDGAMREMMEKSLRVWAAEGVEPGDSWSITLDQSVPMVGTMTSDATVTLKDVTTIDGRRIARIGTTMKLRLVPSGAEVEGMPPGMKFSMEGGTGEGETLFDLDAGHMRSMRMVMEMPMEMKMPLSDGGEMSVKQDMTSTVAMERIEPAAPGGKSSAPAE